jgi:hypothetical protein
MRCVVMRCFFSCFVLIVAALFSACRTPGLTVYPLLDLDDRTPTDHVDVFPDPDSLTRPYNEIAVIAVTDVDAAYNIGEDHRDAMEALIEKAKELGADAIAVIQERDPNMLSGGERPRSAERIARAVGRKDILRRKGILPTSVWKIWVVAVKYRNR